MYFLQQIRIRSHNYVYLKIILTQEEEHSQRSRQLTVEFSIHFVHFIHIYMNPLHVMTAKLTKQIKNIGNGQKLKSFCPTGLNFSQIQPHTKMGAEGGG